MKRYLFKTSFTILACSAFIIQVHARSNYPGDTARLSADTTKKPGILIEPVGFSNGIPDERNTDDLVESNLLHADNYTIKTKADVRALFHFLKSTRLRNASRDKRISYRLYFGLAKTFVRMKLYPQAMQCYYQTLLIAGEKISGNDSSQLHLNNDTAAYFFDGDNNPTAAAVPLAVDSMPIHVLSPANAFDYIRDNDTGVEKYLQQNKASLPVSNEEVTASYNNEEQGVAYAIILHVKQPVPGKRVSFTHINNVGHFFVTLIKYNAGTGAVTRSFGFYPQKEHFFSATPLHPGSASVLKDDALHDWDEAIGKFISRRRFEKIIRLIDHYNARSYHLSKNNCTDFGLFAASIAGVSISNTNGSWPLGKGNNPANAGQSILEGKIFNTDTGNTQDLFICNNIQGK